MQAISSSWSLNTKRAARTSIDSISEILDVPNTVVVAGTNGSNLDCDKEKNDSCSGEFHDTGRFRCAEGCVLTKSDLGLRALGEPERKNLSG